MINRAYEVHGKVARFYMLRTRARASERGRQINYHFYARHPRVAVRVRLEMGGICVRVLARETERNKDRAHRVFRSSRKVYFINRNLSALAPSRRAEMSTLRFNINASYTFWDTQIRAAPCNLCITLFPAARDQIIK